MSSFLNKISLLHTAGNKGVPWDRDGDSHWRPRTLDPSLHIRRILSQQIEGLSRNRKLKILIPCIDCWAFRACTTGSYWILVESEKAMPRLPREPISTFPSFFIALLIASSFEKWIIIFGYIGFVLVNQYGHAGWRAAPFIPVTVI